MVPTGNHITALFTCWLSPIVYLANENSDLDNHLFEGLLRGFIFHFIHFHYRCSFNLINDNIHFQMLWISQITLATILNASTHIFFFQTGSREHISQTATLFMDNHDTRKRQSEMMSVSSASLTSLILQQLDVLQSHQRHKTRNINTLTEQLSLLKAYMWNPNKFSIGYSSSNHVCNSSQRLTKLTQQYLYKSFIFWLKEFIF